MKKRIAICLLFSLPFFRRAEEIIKKGELLTVERCVR